MAFKVAEKDKIARRPEYTPKIYVVNEPPVTIEHEGKRYECKNLIQSVQGLLCVQYDNTIVLITQGQQQPQQPPRAQLV